MVYQCEGKRRVHQSHVYAAFVGRIGHHILIACLAQKRATGEIAHHSVVLHLAQRHHIRQLPSVLSVATSQERLPYMVELAPIAGACPAVRTVGQKLRIVLQRVVGAVEQILAVEFNEREK